MLLDLKCLQRFVLIWHGAARSFLADSNEAKHDAPMVVHGHIGLDITINRTTFLWQLCRPTCNVYVLMAVFQVDLG